MRRLPFLAPAAALAMLLAACSTSGSTPRSAPTTTGSHASTSTGAVHHAGDRADALCHGATPTRTGQIADPELTEISGVVASPDQQRVLWVHNDSGAPNVIWALDPTGEVLARDTVTDAAAVDWEDIAWSVDRGSKRAALYLADIGDNAFTPVVGRKLEPRTTTDPPTIYRIREPDATSGDVATEPAAAFAIAYGDGARDAEAMFVDPITGDGFVISKQWNGAAAGLYRIPASVLDAAHAPDGITTMARVADVGRSRRALVTGADISADGTLVALRTYGDVRLWDRDPQESIADTLTTSPTCSRTVEEHQGEAVAVVDEGHALVTVSEGADATLDWLRLPAN